MRADRYSAHGPEAESEPGSRGRVLRNLLGIRSVREMARRVSVVVAPEFAGRGAAEWPHRLRLTLRDGRSLEGFSLTPPGGADAPIDQHAFHAKARDLIEGVLGPARFDPLEAALAAPERITARALLALLETPQ